MTEFPQNLREEQMTIFRDQYGIKIEMIFNSWLTIISFCGEKLSLIVNTL